MLFFQNFWSVTEPKSTQKGMNHKPGISPSSNLSKSQGLISSLSWVYGNCLSGSKVNTFCFLVCLGQIGSALTPAVLDFLSLERTSSKILFFSDGNTEVGAGLELPLVWRASVGGPGIGNGTAGYNIGDEGVICPVGDVPNLDGDDVVAVAPPEVPTVRDCGLILALESTSQGASGGQYRWGGTWRCWWRVRSLLISAG